MLQSKALFKQSWLLSFSKQLLKIVNTFLKIIIHLQKNSWNIRKIFLIFIETVQNISESNTAAALRRQLAALKLQATFVNNVDVSINLELYNA